MPRKEKIRDMFDSIADDYDKLNHIMSLDIDKTWRKRALKRIFQATVIEKNNGGIDIDRTGRISGGINVLDIACGTGDFSIAIAEEMKKYGTAGRAAGQTAETSGNENGTSRRAGHITGVDLSEGMLAVMDEKIKAGELGGIISTETGDCENLRFEDNTFERAAVAFGVRNFENREKGLQEILRVLKPGGKLVILELSVPSNTLMRLLYNLYFVHILPIIGGKVSGDKAAYRYLPASVLNFPGKKAFMQTLTDCGYINVYHKAFTFGICRMYIGEKGETTTQG